MTDYKSGEAPESVRLRGLAVHAGLPRRTQSKKIPGQAEFHSLAEADLNWMASAQGLPLYPASL